MAGLVQQERLEDMYKYDEDQSLEEIKNYIDKTYDQHYSKNKFQTTEFLIDAGHGTGFCLGSIMKYSQRYGHKGTPDEWRKDIFKIIHYAIIMLHVHDTTTEKKNNKRVEK